MIIDFNKIETQHFSGFKGGEKTTSANMFVSDEIKILRGCLVHGASIGYHIHETNSEIIYILSGNAKLLYDDTEEYVKAGQCHYCPKGHSHSLINDASEDLIFFAVVPEQ